MRLHTHMPAFGKATTERRQFAPQSNEKQCFARFRKILSVRVFVPSDRTPNSPNVESVIDFVRFFRLYFRSFSSEFHEQHRRSDITAQQFQRLLQSSVIVAGFPVVAVPAELALKEA